MTEQIDMAQFVEAKSDQLNADDLIGAPRTIKVRKITGNDGDQPISIFYDGDDNKPFRPCKTMRRVLLAIWGRHASEYIGRAMTLYRDDNVTFGGLNVGGIRISHMSHLEKETVVVVMKSKGKKAGIKVLPLKTEKQKTEKSTYDTEEIVDPNAIARKKAENWTEQYLAAIKECRTTEQLIERQVKSADTLQKLSAEHEDLHALTVTAGTKRAAELQETAEA